MHTATATHLLSQFLTAHACDHAEAQAEHIATLPTDELMNEAMQAPDASPLTVALIDHLESYAQELEALENEVRMLRGLPSRERCQVIELHTRRPVA